MELILESDGPTLALGCLGRGGCDDREAIFRAHETSSEGRATLGCGFRLR
jgi:hypothetical protein